jgi:hypothetical protein
MPIRFRCAYCSQLMGIARRKAGTVVSCPTCHGQVVVPSPGPSADEPKKTGNGANGPALFERSDFDEVFSPPGGGPAPAPPAALPAAPPPAPPPWGPTQAEINFDVERIDVPLPAPGTQVGRPGIWLSPTALTLLGLLVIILLAVAFVAGLLVRPSLGG